MLSQIPKLYIEEEYWKGYFHGFNMLRVVRCKFNHLDEVFFD